MAPPPLNASDLFALELTDSFIDLNRLTATHRARVVSMLVVLENDLVDKIRRLDLEGRSASWRSRRIEKLLRDTRATLKSRFGLIEQRATKGLREVAFLAHDQGVKTVNRVFTVDILTPTLTRQDLKALVDRDVVLGEPAKEWWAGQQEGTRRRFAREMRLGIMQGETNDELIRRVRGRSTGRTIKITQANGKTKRVREFVGGIMDTSRHEADALVRTSAMSVANQANLETYQANGDVIKGNEAITTLDSRTSAICMARTGASWDLETGEPLPESTVDESFPGAPPWHFFCRTVLGPVTYSWKELVERAQGRKAKLLNTVPDSVRATMDGRIATSSVRSFDDWLHIKGDTFARKKLGPGLFDLWKSGKITLSQLIDQGGRILPQRELRKLARR